MNIFDTSLKIISHYIKYSIILTYPFPKIVRNHMNVYDFVKPLERMISTLTNYMEETKMRHQVTLKSLL